MKDTVLLVLVLVGGAALAWYLLGKGQEAPQPLTTKGMDPVQPNQCGQVITSVSGVPICSSSIKAGSAVVSHVAQALGITSSPPSIEGCPYGTRDPSTHVMQRTQLEVSQCLEWLKGCKKTCIVASAGLGQIRGSWPYGKQPGVCIQSTSLCTPPSIATLGWRG